MKKFFSIPLILLVLITSGFTSQTSVESTALIVIEDIHPNRANVTALEYPGAGAVIIDMLNASDQVLSTIQTSPGHTVTFSLSGQEHKVRARFYSDGGNYVIMDEENM